MTRCKSGSAPVAARNTMAMLCGSLVLLTTAGALADHIGHDSGYEAPEYAGSPAGTELNGQQGFYNPDPPNSVTAHVYTYAGNTLGLPVNPGGEEQFVGATGPGGSIYARSQKDIDYDTGTGKWKLAFDVAITYTGDLPTADNIGSLSTQPLDVTTPANAGCIILARWTDPATAANWNADYAYWDDAGTTFIIGSVPDPAFQNLAANHWYRWCTIIDFDSNLIVEVSITDLATGETATHEPVGWNLSGGAGGTLPQPTGFRFFAGTITQPGNTMAFDNVEILPYIECPWDLNGDGVVGPADLAVLLGNWGNPYGPPELALLLGNWGPCTN